METDRTFGKDEGLRAAEQALEAAGWDPTTNLGQNMISVLTLHNMRAVHE